MSLADLTITLYRKGTAALDAAASAELHKQVPQWSVVNVNGIAQLQRHFDFHNFAEALAFTNAVGALADAADHHPAITTEWGKVQVCWWTHTVRGLHRNDFVMAARCDRLYLTNADR